MDVESRESVNPYQVTPACLNPTAPPIMASQARSCSMAVVSMALGIAAIGGFFSCGLLIFLAPAAAVLGHLARKQLREDPTLTGQGMATAGLVLGYLGTALLAIGFIALVVFVVAENFDSF